MNLHSFSHTEYKRYCKAEGSQHIVSEFALMNILKLIKRYRLKNILEVGVGIGTISGSILKYARKNDLNINCIGTEANNFCLNQIPLNLQEDFKSLDLYHNIPVIPHSIKFDLIIVDGAELYLEDIKTKLKSRAIVVIEGDRSEQVEVVREIYPQSRYVQLISTEKNGDYSVKRSEDFQGGLKVIFTDPDLTQLIHWSYLKLKAKIKFKQRKYN